MYKLFGINPLGSHIINFVIHCFNSLLVIYISKRILSNRFLAWATGAFYVAAFRVHFDPLCWMVGFCDLGAMFAFLLSMALFIRGNKLVSAVIFVLGFFIKEHIIVLIAILPLYAYLMEFRSQFSFKRILKTILPHCLGLLIFYLPIKMSILKNVHISAQDPYGVSSSIPNALSNLRVLSTFGLEALCSLTPCGLSDPINLGFVALGMVLFIWAVLRRGIKFSGRTGLLVAWIVIAALPPALLANHAMEGYYFTYSFPALAMLAVLGIRYVISGFSYSHRARVILILALLLVNISSVTYSFKQQDYAGINAPLLDDCLIPRAHFARMLERYLSSRSSRIASGTTIVIDRVNDRLYMPVDKQLEVLLNDPSIKGYVVVSLVHDSTGYYALVPEAGRIARIDLQKDKILYLRLVDDKLVECPLP